MTMRSSGEHDAKAPQAIGILHPGEMGAAVGASLVREGRAVRWVSDGRSSASAARAATAGLTDAGSIARLAESCGLVVSVCPPHAALTLARQVAAAGFSGYYLDANAVSPSTAREVGHVVEAAGAVFVDGGIIGPPPVRPGTSRLYLSGGHAGQVRDWLTTPAIDVRIVSEAPGSASALKLTYAAWTKGSAALLLAIRSAAVTTGVESALLAEWAISLPDLEQRSLTASRSGAAKGWRWSGEMDEIAEMFGTVGLPEGFHRAAAEVFKDLPWVPDEGDHGSP
jgi:3-hydroxyisobutyrate dehydrogenase-like beta-hydroxyacid dehydrogenase